MMADPKLLRPLLKSIIHTKKKAIAHYNLHILKKQNYKLAHLLQDNKSNHRLSLEELFHNDSVKHGPV